MGVQIFHEFDLKEFYNKSIPGYETFDNYYAPEIFTEAKISIGIPIDQARVISFGMEPAIALYNGFYTVDGYTTNYPLTYKKQFRKVIAKFLDTRSSHNNYDEWGSKVYLMGIPSMKELYQKGTVVHNLPFSTKPLCDLGTNYLLSVYEIDTREYLTLQLIKSFNGKTKEMWDLYLYKIVCSNK
jgi:hypothetical protein